MVNMQTATLVMNSRAAGRRAFSVVGALLIVLALLGSAAGAADLGNQKMYEAMRTDKPPVIDGKLDDACWQQASSGGEFWKLSGAAAVVQPTSFQFAYDSQNIYLAVTNVECNLGALKCDIRVDDMSSVMGDEADEWFLQPDGSGDYYQFAANCVGARYDGCAFDATWNGKWQAAAGRTDKAWTLECAISFASFGRYGVPGAMWGLNVCRDRQAGGDTEWSAWSPTPGGFHQPQNFGRLIFGGRAGGGVDRAALIESARAALKSLDLEQRLNEAMQTIRSGKLPDMKPEQRQQLDAQMAEGKAALDALTKLLQSDKPLDTRAWVTTNARLQAALDALDGAAWQVRFEILLGD